MKAIVCIRRTIGGWARPTLIAGVALAGGALAGGALAGGILAKAEEDIRDIRGPKAMPAGFWLLPATLAAAALLVGFCAAYALWRRNRGARRQNPTLAEQTLESLEGTRRLMHPSTAREFGTAASEVMRRYIERRFGISATQQTTEEFLQALLQSSNDTPARHRSLLAQFLHECDFVKFAGASLAVTDMEALLQSARGFVLETTELRAA